MAFKQIAFAQANWDKVVNSNLAKTTELEDTGWLKTTILAPAIGHVEYRRLNHILFLRGSITPHITGNVKITNIPLISGIHFIVNNANQDAAAGAEIDSNSDLYLKKVPENSVSQVFVFLNGFYCGPENILGGA